MQEAASVYPPSVFLTEVESTIRLIFTISLFLCFAMLEALSPRRQVTKPRIKRWFSNISLSLFNGLFVRFLVPLSLIHWAMVLQTQGWGLLNASELSKLPTTVQVLLCVLLLELVIYWQHRLFHRIPLLWRLHRLHHSDIEVDVTTALRFHPFEILLSYIIKLIFITLLGAPALAVLIFEVILNGCALFNHSNFKIPKPIDKALRSVLVTPDMHRIHHSIRKPETDSNFGFNLSLWDRVFRSYTEEPQQNHKTMTLGLEEFRDAKSQKLHRLLLQPFCSSKHSDSLEN